MTSSDELDDAQLLTGLQKGGRAAELVMEQLMVLCERPLVNFLGRMTGSRVTGEDLAQEVLIRLLREAPEMEASGSVRGWIWTVAANLARDHLRRRRFELVTGDFNLLPAPEPAPTGLRDRVQGVLDLLTEGDRLCLVLRDMEGMAYEALAGMLGISEVAARVRVHRARERFRELYLAQKGEAHASAG